VLRVQARELPDPGPGQVLVRMEATGVSFAEQQRRLAKYYDQPAFPFVPGYDLVGVVESGPRSGERVAALTKVGAWADRVVLDEDALVPVPENVSADEAETVIVNGVTAYRMLHRSARARAGQTVVVLGAAGGVGSTPVWAGARRRARLRAQLHADLEAVFDMLARGEIAAQIAARFPLSEAPAALRFAEAGGHTGKVVLMADAPR
jgi:NADPH:quinone reductase-like Zn-dependent oxidoreductase